MEPRSTKIAPALGLFLLASGGILFLAAEHLVPLLIAATSARRLGFGYAIAWCHGAPPIDFLRAQPTGPHVHLRSANPSAARCRCFRRWEAPVAYSGYVKRAGLQWPLGNTAARQMAARAEFLLRIDTGDMHRYSFTYLLQATAF